MDIYKVVPLVFLYFLYTPSYALDFSFLDFETQEEEVLNAIQRDEYLNLHFTRDEYYDPNFTYESSIARLSQKEHCLKIPHFIHQGEPQKRNNQSAFKWVIDVPVKSKKSNRIITKIVELDALATVGLLSKEFVTLETESGTKDFVRYRLTLKGWEAQINRRAEACFYIGKAKHLKVQSINKLELPVGEGKKDIVYKVLVLVGLADPLSLPEWANHPEMRKAYPQMTKLVGGYEREILMQKESGRWHEYLSPEKLKRMAKYGHGRSKNYYNKSEPKTSKEAIRKSILLNEDRYRKAGCIFLPGDSSNGARVDKNLSMTKPYTYRVAIDDNKLREEWDTIASKTKPYLERLVDSGLLTSYSKDKIYVGKEGRGKYFSGTVYQLSPSYRHIYDEGRRCISLGKGVIDVIRLDILAENTPEVSAGSERVSYKYIMNFPNPPAWAKDKVLQAWWPDLKGALKYGRACEGEFKIDLTQERNTGRIAGRCWWAFNSFSAL